MMSQGHMLADVVAIIGEEEMGGRGREGEERRMGDGLREEGGPVQFTVNIVLSLHMCCVVISHKICIIIKSNTADT